MCIRDSAYPGLGVAKVHSNRAHPGLGVAKVHSNRAHPGLWCKLHIEGKSQRGKGESDTQH
eukprot:6842117-Alexandrium_andersonii.AAC.1